MGQKIGRGDDLNEKVSVRKRQWPHQESAQGLTLADNILAGGARLEASELRRTDENYLPGLGAQRLPAPPPAGDFTRRFAPEDTLALMEAIKASRPRVGQLQPEGFLNETVIAVEGRIAGTLGECKEGMDISDKGVWGDHPPIGSPANTQEGLSRGNRPGNVPSHQGAVEWSARAIPLVRPHADRIFIRGDTDFSCTRQFDEGDDSAVKFVFGLEANPTLVKRAEALPGSRWRGLERVARPLKTEPRQRPENVKERIVKEREFVNQRLESEQVAAGEYQPGKGTRPYRLVSVRKNLSVEKGEAYLFPKIRGFFHSTNRRELAGPEVVPQAPERCNQENVIAQLKGGVNARRRPVNDRASHWAYRVMTALAWNLPAWFGLLLPPQSRGAEVGKREFRSILQRRLLIPAQIIRAGRKVSDRVMRYTAWPRDFLAPGESLRKLRV